MDFSQASVSTVAGFVNKKKHSGTANIQNFYMKTKKNPKVKSGSVKVLSIHRYQ
jgi:hypothetical protein